MANDAKSLNKLCRRRDLRCRIRNTAWRVFYCSLTFSLFLNPLALFAQYRDFPLQIVGVATRSNGAIITLWCRRGETQGAGFQCVSLYVLCCFFCSVVRGSFSCDRFVFRRCYTRYYMPISSLHGGTRCYMSSVLRCYTEAIIIKQLMASCLSKYISLRKVRLELQGFGTYHLLLALMRRRWISSIQISPCAD